MKLGGKGELIVEWGNGNDGLAEISVKLKTRGREWIVAMKDADASGELWFIVIWINN